MAKRTIVRAFLLAALCAGCSREESGWVASALLDVDGGADDAALVTDDGGDPDFDAGLALFQPADMGAFDEVPDAGEMPTADVPDEDCPCDVAVVARALDEASPDAGDDPAPGCDAKDDLLAEIKALEKFIEIFVKAAETIEKNLKTLTDARERFQTGVDFDRFVVDLLEKRGKITADEAKAYRAKIKTEEDRLNKVKTKLDDLAKKLKGAKDKLADAQKDLAAAKALLGACPPDIKGAKEKIKSAQDKALEAIKDLADVETGLKDADKELEDIRVKLKKILDELIEKYK